MKFVCGIFVLFAVILTATSKSSENSESSEELEELINEQSKVCQKETNASEKDVQNLLEGVEPTTKIGKCLYGCLLNKLGVINQANQLVAEKLHLIVDDKSIKSKDGKPLKGIMKDVIEACKSISDPDKCEVAIKIVACLNAESKKRGFDKNVF